MAASLGLASALWLASACEGSTLPEIGEEVPELARLEQAPALAVQLPAWARVPVPAEDGPKLASVSMITPIYGDPSRAHDAVGYLRAGARVSRSAQAVSREGCEAGWFAVRPVGFVCAERDATLQMDHPVARALSVEPDRAKPMP